MFFFDFSDINSSLDHHIERIKKISAHFACKDVLISYLICLRAELVNNNFSSDIKKKILSLNSHLYVLLDKKEFYELEFEQIINQIKDILLQLNNNDSNYNTNDFYIDEIKRLKEQLQKCIFRRIPVQHFR